MRELKFRYWDDEKEKMFGPFSPLELGCVDEDYLMQYIGVKDKVGNEIYEGDILREDKEWDNDEAFIGKVEFSAPKFAITWLKKDKGYTYSLGPGLFGELPYYTLIGNIYESPELMEK